MDGLFCQSVIVFTVPIFMIVLGLVYISNKDWAWRIAEWMLRSVRPQRTPEWEFYATVNGVISLAFGLLIALFLPYLIFFS
jgi:hypothetical protein